MTASHWLVKSEPNTYSFDDLVRDGKTVWDGVRNNAAALHLKAMKAGDEVLFYHSQEGLAVVGVARVTRAACPAASSVPAKLALPDSARENTPSPELTSPT